MITLTEARNRMVESLADRYGDGEAASIARIVMEDVFFSGKRGKDEVLNNEEMARLEILSDRLAAGEPVQYVTGEADFFGYRFRVSPAVLIPRQETEELVAWALDELKSRTETSVSLLDIGCGSGCIGLILRRKQPGLHLVSIDKSPEALRIAEENALRLLGPGAPGNTFLELDILDRAQWPRLPLFDVIVSNPPYIPETEKHLLPEHVLAHEPALALFVDSQDPLLFYRVIADLAKQHLKTGGALFFECNEFNAMQVRDMLSQSGFDRVELRRDLSGADRMIRASLNK